jgi:hypothetical protein
LLPTNKSFAMGLERTRVESRARPLKEAEGATSNRLTLPFAGPFAWSVELDSPCVFEVDERHQSGIYLVTVPLPSGHLVYYVGETGTSFEKRLHAHYGNHFKAEYHVYSASELACGEKVVLWPGLIDIVDRKSKQDCAENRQRLNGLIQQMMRVYRLFLAPLSRDKRTRCRVKAAIAETLRTGDGKIGNFQDPTVRYHPRREAEDPIELTISSPLPLLGLPDRLLA